MNTSNITQEYLEKVHKEAAKVEELINLVLERALCDAKRGYGMSNTFIHNSEHTYEQLKLAGDELIKRGFKANYSHENYSDANGYIGEIQMYFGENFSR